MPDVLVLCYHAVSERWNAELSVTPRALREQLGALVKRGYQGTTFSEAVSERPRAKTVAVTFDDGYRSVVDLALPILDELGLPATVFVVADFVGRAGPMVWSGIDRWLGTEHESELRSLSWEDARALVARGWEIGSHTFSHPSLTRVSDSTLQAELTESKKRCEQGLGGSCSSLAYPYGDYDARVVAAADAAGYSFACSLPQSFTRPSSLVWPRVGVYHRDTDESFQRKISPAVRRLRASIVWPALQAGRHRWAALRCSL